MIPPKWYQFFVGLFASLGSATYGYDLGVIAGVQDSNNFQSSFSPSEPELGAVVALFTAGAFFGAGFAGPIADLLGRRLCLMVGSGIFILGGFLQCFAVVGNLSFMYSGRAIGGLGVGILIMIIPPYQAELCHPSIRGRVTGLQQFMLGIGNLIASWTTYACYNHIPDSSTNQWRIPLGIQVVPAGILGLLILLFPESPRWLVQKGRNEYALATLARLHSRGDTEDAWVQAEYTQIVDQIAHEREFEATSYMELFKNKSSFRRLFIAMSLQASVQMTGISAIQYYSPDIFRQIGIPAGETLQYQAINAVIALIAQFCCMMFIDRLGRRWTLIGGNSANCITFIIATALFANFPPTETRNLSASWAFIVMTWIYNFSFSATCGPLSWIIPAEIFDTRTRSKGVSIATMTSMAFNTLIAQVTPIALDAVAWQYYILFIVTNATNAIFFWCILPETAKRPLEEMNYLFTNAPLFVPTMNMKDFASHELDSRAQNLEKKGSLGGDEQYESKDQYDSREKV
ncbi:hypothetical protein MBLNU230_g2588t1 [Neophaeotheca triangularis]